ncbi:MAG: oligosaccharide flippase family protein [Ruminococcus sp.]|nr:oligosaccharide flippase family protein [Ruminococcus sp.]
MKHSIAKDTIFMTIVDFILQGISLLMNIFLTRKLGEEMVGIISLVMSFYSTLVVISNGNSFLCANRFISEERGKAKGNPNTILMYSIVWSAILSIISTVLIVTFSSKLCESLLDNVEYANGIKIIASTLVITAMSSSIKGYFHAHRSVTIPLVSGCLEFFVRNVLTVIMVYMLHTNVIIILSISMLVSESTSLVFLMISLVRNIKKTNSITDTSFKRYIKSSIPIALNSSIPLILSTCNDALLPITLKQCGSSSEQSFGLYGMFEAIVLPIVFFPSSILCSLSCIIVPEVARCNASGNYARVRRVSFKAIRLTLIFSIMVSIGLFILGDDIALLIGSTSFSGKIVKMLSPIVPLIYLEIVLESILKGLGKHGFSSINYIAEYIVRISTLLICVPLLHFYGVVVSYYMSNIVGNISRIIKVCKVIPRCDVTQSIKT